MKNNTGFEPKYVPTGTPNRKMHNILLFPVVFFFAVSTLLSCKNNTTNQNQDQAKIDSIAVIKDTLQSQYNAARMQIDNDATKSAQLDSMIREKDKQIAMLKSENSKLSKNNKKMAAELKTDKKLIASLKGDLNQKTKDYEDKLAALENDKNNLIKQRDELLSKYNKILALGSVLHASNIRLMAEHLKHHGTVEKNTKHARKADVLKVVFDIDENRIAENGTKKLYLVITDPSGTLLSNTASGSGVTTNSNGTPLNYSVLKEIPLVTNEPVKDVEVEWKQDDDFKKGTYSIAIYNGGYKIGGGQVELK